MLKHSISILVINILFLFPGCSSGKALEKGEVIEPGVMLHKIGSSHCDTKLWVYLPDYEPGEKLACVFVAPAGTDLLSGVGLAEGDRSEHLPYVKAGYAVVAYEIDGEKPRDASDQRFIQSLNKFRAAKAGVTNARQAIRFAEENLPIDPDRVYVAGHSSAGTLALQCAWSIPSVKACVAYCPGSDIEAYWRDDLVWLEDNSTGTKAFIRDINPMSKAETIPCPVFLFASEEDGVASIQDIDRLAGRMEKNNCKLERLTVPTGDHYNAMISQGLPAGIEWLNKLQKKG
jgi:dipeptidyl aminopeptidase/acylaminoacyl peptidase